MNRTLRRLIVLGLVLQGAATAAHAQSDAVQILSATVRDQKIEGATVTLQQNGEQSVVATTDGDGRARLRDLLRANPTALIIVRKSGYSDLVARCPCAGMTYAVSPIMDKLDGMRVVLNWGATPRDLDLHLAFPANHVFFFRKSGTDAQLDVDHRDGYGPETITITRKHPGERYVFAVHDFSDSYEPNTTFLSLSNAKVFVYVGQTLIRTYYVPTDQKGNVWKVFAISEDGELQDINAMSGASAYAPGQLTTSLIFGENLDPRGDELASGSSASHAMDATDAPIPDAARKINTQGESAYREGNYERAMELFREAIAIDDDYGQAYSNLGLAFQKSGRVAEALWANRKAIALAHGANAATVRASTHFNNGRIYEDSGQWSDAVREYRAAEAEKPKVTYENGIARALQHGAR